MSPPESVLSVRTITAAEHLDLIRSRPSASFLQTPAWGEVKSDWRHESIGWHDAAGTLRGAGLVLYRKTPLVDRYLAYLPEGPVIDWEADDLAGWLTPMAAHLRRQRAFGVRIGPPVVTRRWSADAVKAGIAEDGVRTLGDVTPLERSQLGAQVVSQLRELGWQHQQVDAGFAAGQPQYNFWIPLTRGDDRLSEDDLLRTMNQQWRRNIKKSAKEGVVVSTAPTTDDRWLADLQSFHELYTATAQRDHFTPRPLSYFETMFRALLAEEPDRVRLYLARHEDTLVAATVWIRVGTHTWYSYGASSTDKREVRGSNAAQWAMMRDALAAGADVYDLRGITETLHRDDPHIGLIQFKVGTGGEAVEYAGEWDLPLSKVLYQAFALYMRRRPGSERR